jgi:hypothetical protein
MNQKEKNQEKKLEEVLELYEKGKPIPEILALFKGKKEEKELGELLKIAKLLQEQKSDAPPTLLKQALNKLQSGSVIKSENHRYKKRGEIKGRPSFALMVSNFRMKFKINQWKIVAPIAVLAVVLLAIIVSSQLGSKPVNLELALNETQKEVQEFDDLAQISDNYINGETTLEDFDETLNSLNHSQQTEERKTETPETGSTETKTTVTEKETQELNQELEQETTGEESELDEFFSDEIATEKAIDDALSGF